MVIFFGKAETDSEFKERAAKLKKPKRKISLSGLHKKAWDLFSKIVRIEERGVCYTCGKIDHWKNQHAGHFKHKDCMDFIRRNIHCQCPQCNKWKHGKLDAYAEHLVKDYGPSILEELTIMSNKLKKFSRGELEDLIEDYKKKLEEVKP